LSHDDLPADEVPEFSTYKQVFDRLFVFKHEGDDRCREMLAHVLVRVPYMDQLSLLATTRFVMATDNAQYLSAKLVDGKSVLVLGEGLLDLPEDQQVAAILPQAARCVVRSKHPHESARETTDEEWQEIEAAYDAGDVGKLEENSKLYHASSADLSVEVRFANNKADELAQSWLDRWNARSTSRPRPSG